MGLSLSLWTSGIPMEIWKGGLARDYYRRSELQSGRGVRSPFRPRYLGDLGLFRDGLFCWYFWVLFGVKYLIHDVKTIYCKVETI